MRNIVQYKLDTEMCEYFIYKYECRFLFVKPIEKCSNIRYFLFNISLGTNMQGQALLLEFSQFLIYTHYFVINYYIHFSTI